MKMCRTVLMFLGIIAAMLASSGLWMSSVAQTPKPDADAAVKAERAKLLGTVPLSRPGEFEARPNEQGDYVYEASSAKVLLTDGSFKIENDWHVKGLTVATIEQVVVPLASGPTRACIGNWGIFSRANISSARFTVPTTAKSRPRRRSTPST